MATVCVYFFNVEKIKYSSNAFFLFFTATNFSKIIAELEVTQHSLLTSIAGNKVLLQNVQEAFATNLDNVKIEASKLEARVNRLAK